MTDCMCICIMYGTYNMLQCGTINIDVTQTSTAYNRTTCRSRKSQKMCTARNTTKRKFCKVLHHRTRTRLLCLQLCTLQVCNMLLHLSGK